MKPPDVSPAVLGFDYEIRNAISYNATFAKPYCTRIPYFSEIEQAAMDSGWQQVHG